MDLSGRGRGENLWDRTEREYKKYILTSETNIKYTENLANINFEIFWILIICTCRIEWARITFLGLGSDLKIIIEYGSRFGFISTSLVNIQS